MPKSPSLTSIPEKVSAHTATPTTSHTGQKKKGEESDARGHRSLQRAATETKRRKAEEKHIQEEQIESPRDSSRLHNASGDLDDLAEASKSPRRQSMTRSEKPQAKNSQSNPGGTRRSLSKSMTVNAKSAEKEKAARPLNRILRDPERASKRATLAPIHTTPSWSQHNARRTGSADDLHTLAASFRNSSGDSLPSLKVCSNKVSSFELIIPAPSNEN